MKKYFLGIFECHSDTSAAISCNGKIIAFTEEERFIREKHAFGKFPEHSIRYCIESAKIQPNQIEAICINWETSIYQNGEIKKFFDKKINKKFVVDKNSLDWQRKIQIQFSTFECKKRIQMNWKKIFGKIKCPKIISSNHHFNHAFQAYHNSGFKKSLCLTIDGFGDKECTTIWKCDNKKIVPIKKIEAPNSLGWFYSAFTEFFGFTAYDGEYKLMGLASYGQKNIKLRKKILKVLYYNEAENTYNLNPYFIHYGSHSWSARFTDKLIDLIGIPPLNKTNKYKRIYYDLAFEVQYALENIVCKLVSYYMPTYKQANLCIGGGVGLNIKMNTALYNLDCVKDIYIHPLCFDGGSSTSSAQIADFQITKSNPKKITNLFLGKDYKSKEVKDILINNKIQYYKFPKLEKKIAKFLSEGKIVGWFQGRAEAGPRALGNRSILADPRFAENRDKVNKAIKYREMWRPFCPSILYEFSHNYLEKSFYAPNMIISFKVKELMKKIAPAVVHIDNTSRVQTVTKKDNKKYYELINCFYKLTNVPMLLNTSFNLKGEPIVNSPNDALRTFFSSSLDILVINEYVIIK